MLERHNLWCSTGTGGETISICYTGGVNFFIQWSVQYLAVVVDSQLVCKKEMPYQSRTASHFSPFSTQAKLYNVLVLTHIDYCWY